MSATGTTPYFPQGLWERSFHHNKRDVEPPQLKIKGVDKYEHGTYETFPYYTVIQSRKDPTTNYLVSDTGLRARLTFIPPSLLITRADGQECWGAKFKLSFEGENAPKFENAILSYNLEPDAAGDVFIISGTTPDFAELPSGDFPDGSYVRSFPREPNDEQKTEKWGSPFVPRETLFYCLQNSWYLRDIDLLKGDFLARGRGPKVFELPSGDSRDYGQAGAHNVPYGWRYKGWQIGQGRMVSKMSSSSTDVTTSVRQAAGFHVNGEAGVRFGEVDKGMGLEVKASFSVSGNTDLANQLGNMYKEEKTLIQASAIRIDSVFFLDKRNVKLSDTFRQEVTQLQRALARPPSEREERRSDEQLLLGFLSNWGTHYAYACTFGVKGWETKILSKNEVHTLIATETNLKKAFEAGLSVTVGPGIVKAGGGGDSEENKKHQEQLTTILENAQEEKGTLGGTIISGIDPGAGNYIPLYFDLRPISDLLGVPFYTDEGTAITLRAQLARLIANYVFTPPNEDQVGDTIRGYREIEFGKLRVDVSEPKPPYEYWTDQEGERSIKGEYAKDTMDVFKTPSQWRVSVVLPSDATIVYTKAAHLVPSGKGQAMEVSSLGNTRALLMANRSKGSSTSSIAKQVKVGVNVTTGIDTEYMGRGIRSLVCANCGTATGQISAGRGAPHIEVGHHRPALRFDETDPRTFFNLDLTKPGTTTVSLELYDMDVHKEPPTGFIELEKYGPGKRAMNYPIKLTFDVTVRAPSMRELLGLDDRDDEEPLLE